MDEKKRLTELANRAVYTGRAQFTRFLDPSQERDARAAAREAGAKAAFFGGYDGAERFVAAFYDETPPDPADYPITALALRWSAKFVTVGHRDLLGAVMALGLERDATGDICMSRAEGQAYLFCTDDMADYLTAALESAGRAKLSVAPTTEIDIAPPEGVSTRVTVQTPRLDAVIAAGYQLSRNDAARLIASGMVKLNHAEELRCDVKVAEGALISVRGYGRLRVDALQGETRRGRLGIMLFRYGK